MIGIALLLIGVLISFLVNFDFNQKVLDRRGFMNSLMIWAVGIIIGQVIMYVFV